MAKGQEVKIGPWPTGINLLDEVDQVQDEQLVSCVNFDVDNVGILEPRRPFRRLNVDPSFTAGSTTNYLMGTVNLIGQEFPRAAIGFYRSGTNDTQVAFFRNPEVEIGGTGPLFAGKYRSVVQYLEKIWYIPANATTVGQNADPATGASGVTAVGAMPWGDYGFILKDRLFIVRKESSELYFSKATDFSIWAAPDGGVIQVNPGDDTPITKVVVINNQVVIFKRDQTYILTFTNSPTADGTLRQVSADQGALDAITYNNEIYCFSARSVFKFVNGYFQDIAVQLNLVNTANFDNSSTVPGRLSIIGDTLMLALASTAFAMNLNTGAWSTYEFDAAFTNVLNTGTITNRSALGKAVFYGDSSGSIYYTLAGRSDAGRPDQAASGVFYPARYEFSTKVLDFDDPMVWKRLYSWYLDAQFLGAKYGAANFTVHRGHYDIAPMVTMIPVGDLMGPNTSCRFRSIRYGFDGKSTAITNVQVGVRIRSLKAIVGVKPSVSQAVTV